MDTLSPGQGVSLSYTGFHADGRAIHAVDADT